ncbi:MAG: hypothetical protein ABMA64_27350 [Myxococcota bacterium]
MADPVNVEGTTIRLRPDGVVEYLYAPIVVDLGHARRVVAATPGDRSAPGPVLVQLGGVRSVTREARQFFATDPLNLSVASRVALVGSNPVARVIGNFFLGLNRSSLPVRLFGSTEDALTWLLAD